MHGKFSLSVWIILLTFFSDHKAWAWSDTIQEKKEQKPVESIARQVPTKPKTHRHKFFKLPDLCRVFCSRVVKVRFTKAGQKQVASGFFVSENGHILTSVLKGESFQIERSDHQIVQAQKLGEDEVSSICLLKIELGANEKVPFFSLIRETGGLKLGQTLVSLSYKFGLNLAPQKGFLTGFNDRFYNNEWPMELVRSSLSLDGGDCGGVVLDKQGRLQGLLLHAVQDSRESFFMPAVGLYRVFQDLLLFGRVRYGYVGLETQVVYDQKSHTACLRILNVAPCSPAFKAGFQPGDILRKVNGVTIDSIGFFKNTMFLSSPGDRFEMEVEREDKIFSFTLEIGERLKCTF